MEENETKKEDDEKPSKNSPSYLIWSIFTKQRGLHKAHSLKKKIYSADGNSAEIIESLHSKSAPAGKRQRDACNHNSADIFASQLSHASFHCSQGQVMDENCLLWIRVEGSSLENKY